ncbi:serine/arginine-rich splicing factor 4-like isoform X2 [Babylonia areolata]|uniref:serine/arginine-rich splicing factor 4-like isoform X2 n=1 Tax=Babylonia areolata TaxID=304850 RepID=UPI003FD58AB8
MGTRVYIGRLPYQAREKDVERFFRGYGRINDIMLKNGYGFVEFEDYRDADDAVYELNGKELCSERVIIEHARGTSRGGYYGGGGGGSSRRSSWVDKAPRYGPPTRTEYRLIVENLSSRVSWQDLKDYMRQAGEVTYADAHTRHRNEGIIEFATYSDMKNALDKLDNTEINGRKIRLVEDRPKKRSRSRSRSRRKKSRSRSRSRRSRSHSRSRSDSRSRSASKSRSKSGSKDRKAKSEDKDKSDSKKRSKSMSRSRSPSRSKSRSPSRSKSPDDHKGDSAPKHNGDAQGKEEDED